VNASQWIMVTAMLLDPILAVQIQKFLEAPRELRRTRMNLFHTLMQTRGNRLDPAHVQAVEASDLCATRNAEHQSDFEMIRRSLADILSGKQAIPVRLTDAPTTPAPHRPPTTPSDQFR